MLTRDIYYGENIGTMNKVFHPKHKFKTNDTKVPYSETPNESK